MNGWKKPAKRIALSWLALGLVALGFGLRLYGLGEESLWYDELLELDIAQGPLGELFPRLRGHTGVPLDYLLLHAWLPWGRGEAWLRFPAAVWGTLTLPLVYRLGRRWLGRAAGLLPLALLALSPLHVHYSQEVRPYALVGLGVTLAVDAFWRLRQTGRLFYLALLQVGVFVSGLAHIFAVVMFVPLALFAGLEGVIGPRRRRALVALAGLGLTGLLPLLILLTLDWGNLLFYTSTEFGQALLEPERFSAAPDQKPNLGLGPQVSPDFIRQKLLAPLAAGEGPALVLLTGLAGLGGVYLLVTKRYRLALFLGLWLLLPPVLILAFLVYRGTFFAVRYIIYVLPAYWLLVGLGLLAGLRFRGPAWFRRSLFVVTGGLVLIFLAGGLLRLYQDQNRENWRLAGSFIATNARPGDVVIAVKAESVLGWYYPPAWAPPNVYSDLPAVQAAAAGSRRSWVVLSIFSSGVDGAIKAWLGEQGAVRFVLDPVIYVYYLGPGLSHEQLLAEIQAFALPADHALYASLARENRRRPDVARRYYELALAHAPDEATRAEYRAALAALP